MNCPKYYHKNAKGKFEKKPEVIDNKFVKSCIPLMLENKAMRLMQ